MLESHSIKEVRRRLADGRTKSYFYDRKTGARLHDLTARIKKTGCVDFGFAAIPHSAFIGGDYIYFVRAKSGPVKIGFSDLPMKRFKSLMAVWHEECELIAVIPGARAREKALHHRFKHLHIRGEWFQGTDGLLSHARDLMKESWPKTLLKSFSKPALENAPELS